MAVPDTTRQPADDGLRQQIENLIQIGAALSGEHDLSSLLEMIVDESRRFTRADGGTLYIVSDDGESLLWRIIQNGTMGTRIGGRSSIEVDERVFKPVELVVDGQRNMAHVSAVAANTGNTINIPDVYKAEAFDFSGTRRYDASFGYRSQSMLVVPLKDHEEEIIGILQLLNAQDESGSVIPFSADYENLILSLASQAAVAITNARLIQDLERLFDAFIETIATAIDEKSPYTAGHVRRVADLTMRIAHTINEADTGVWRRLRFTDDELNELRVAAWMHDVGKITTPEYVVDKAMKLETIADRIQTVRMRYEILKRDAEIASLKRQLAAASAPSMADGRLDRELAALDEEMAFLARCNTGGEFMADADVERLQAIANRTLQIDASSGPLLTQDELENLSIRKGTLTRSEFAIIANHAAVSVRMLSQLPFSRKLKRVPEYAGGHHEKLDGRGYPLGLPAEKLPLQARILAVADIFEALTAPDRPYRKPMTLSAALRIIHSMVDRGELDSRIVEVFTQSSALVSYAKEELAADQIDM